MFTILINVLLALSLTGGLILSGHAAWGWALLWGVLTFLASQLAVGFYLQRLIKTEMQSLEQILKDGQRALQLKVQRWQTRPPGSQKAAQAELERDQRKFVETALEASKALERFRRWSPLMGKQLNAMRLQFHWMLKDFKQVDTLLPHVLILDPAMAAIKLARMYMLEEWEPMSAFFKKQTRRLRYNQGALLYSLYAWILLQRKDIDGAHRILLQAGDKMENDIIKRNRDHLANNRVGHFSNSGLGEEWYALHLEQPKVKVQRQRPHQFGRPF